MKCNHKMRNMGVWCLVMVGCLLSGTIYAQNDVSAQADRQVFLSLEEAIAMALQNNLEIQAKWYDPKIKQEDIRKAEAAFGSSLKGTSAQILKDAPNPNTSPTAITSLETSMSRRLNTGGSLQVGLEMTRSGFDTTDWSAATLAAVGETQYETVLSVTAAHALMKGRGKELNQTPILIAQRQREISVSELRAKIIEIVAKIKTTYWKLIYVRGDLEAKQLSLQLAYDLVKNNEAQVKVGTLAPIEVLQAQATAASREVDIISAEQNVRDVEDELKRLLNISQDDPAWQAAIVPTDQPVSERQVVSLEDSISAALANNESLQQLHKSIEIQEIGLRASENQLLPELGVSGTVSLTGKEEDLFGSTGDVFSFDRPSFTVGASFSYPIGNDDAKSTVNKGKLELDKTRLTIRNVEQVVTTQVKQAIRGVETSYRLVEASKVALQLAEEQLSAEQKKFNEGLSTNFQVLNYQGSLASARSRYTQAITTYNQALVGLEQATGLTLQRHNIVINP